MKYSVSDWLLLLFFLKRLKNYSKNNYVNETHLRYAISERISQIKWKLQSQQ